MSLGIGLFSFNEFLVSTALPSAVRDTGGAALMSWAVTVYLVPSIVGGSCAASLKQRLGARVALFLSGLVFLVGTLIASMASSMTMILLGRAFQGAGDGVIAALCYALIPALFPSVLIPRVFGVEALVWASSAFGGPLVSGWVTQVLSWRAAFLMNVPLIAGFLVLVPLVAPRQAAADSRTLQAGGSAFFRLAGIAGGIMAVAVAAILPVMPARLALLAVALAMLVWTIRADRRSTATLFPASMFQLSSRIGTTWWIILLMPLAQAVSGVYLVLGLQHVWSFRPASAGGIGAIMALSWSAFAFLVAGRPLWRRRMAGMGPALNVVGLSGLLLALQSQWLALVVVAQLVIGAGFGLSWATLSQRIMEGSEAGDRDKATALLPTVQSAGYAIGAAIAGLVANSAGLPHLLATGGSVVAPLSWAYGAAITIAAAAVLVGNRPKQRTENPTHDSGERTPAG